METRKSITIGCGVWGPILSAVIIAARAACGSAPMEEWSVWSWFLMTLPVTVPFVAFVAVLAFCGAAYLLAQAAIWLCDLPSKWRKDR